MKDLLLMLTLLTLVLVMATGCVYTKHNVVAEIKPIEIKPMQITVDINVNLKKNN